MTKRLTLQPFLTLFVLLCSLPLSAQKVMAQSDSELRYEEESPLEDISVVVRRKLLYRSTRFEVAPLVGMTLGDAYNRNLVTGANLSFHLTNEVSIGATFGFVPLTFDTDLREQLEASLTREQRQGVAFSKINYLASLEGGFVPLFGKMSVLNGLILNYDLHLLGGLGFVGRAADPANENEAIVATSLEESTVAPVVGFGARFFLGDFVSFNAQLRNYIYSEALVSRGSAEAELRHHILLSFGLSFFLPTDVKVSR